MNFDIPQIDRIYLMELETQCRFALTAAAASELELNEARPNLDSFWYHIQMFLVSTANIHKMLFNDKQSKYLKHHQTVIDKYKLPEIEFKVEKSIRNKFEHYDEYIVDWIRKSNHHNIALNNVMPKSAIGGNIDFFKNFDPTENILSFGNQDINTEDTCEKINLLYQHILRILEP